MSYYIIHRPNITLFLWSVVTDRIFPNSFGSQLLISFQAIISRYMTDWCLGVVFGSKLQIGFWLNLGGWLPTEFQENFWVIITDWISSEIFFEVITDKIFGIIFGVFYWPNFWQYLWGIITDYLLRRIFGGTYWPTSGKDFWR